MAKSIQKIKKELALFKAELAKYEKYFAADGHIDEQEWLHLQKLQAVIQKCEDKLEAIQGTAVGESLKLKVYVTHNNTPRDQVAVAIMEGPMTRPEIADINTDATGYVEFEGLIPGNYLINCWDIRTNSYWGAAKIDLKADGVAEVHINKGKNTQTVTPKEDTPNPTPKEDKLDLPNPYDDTDTPTTDDLDLQDKKRGATIVEFDFISVDIKKSFGYYRLDKVKGTAVLEPTDLQKFDTYVKVMGAVGKVGDAPLKINAAVGKKFDPMYVVGGVKLGEPMIEAGTKGKAGFKVLQWGTDVGTLRFDFNLVSWDASSKSVDGMISVAQTEVRFSTPAKKLTIDGMDYKGSIRGTLSFSLDKAKVLAKIAETGGKSLASGAATGGAATGAGTTIPMTAISAVEIAAIAAPLAWIGACGYALYTFEKFNSDLWELRTQPKKAADAYAAGFSAGLHGGTDDSSDVSTLGSKAGAKMRTEYIAGFLKNPKVVEWLEANDNDKEAALEEFERKFKLMIPKLVKAAWSSAFSDVRNKKFKEFLEEHGNEGFTLRAWGEFLSQYQNKSRWGDPSYVSPEVWAFIAGKYAGQTFSYGSNEYQLPANQSEMYDLLGIDKREGEEDLFKIEKEFAAFLKTLTYNDFGEPVESAIVSWTLPGNFAVARSSFNSSTGNKATEEDLSDGSIGTMVFAEIDRREKAAANKKLQQKIRKENLKKEDKKNKASVDYGHRTKGVHAKAQGLQSRLGNKIQENSIPRVVVLARDFHNKGNEIFMKAYTKWQNSMKEADLQKRVYLQQEAIGLYESATIHYEAGMDMYLNPPPLKK